MHREKERKKKKKVASEKKTSRLQKVRQWLGKREHSQSTSGDKNGVNIKKKHLQVIT